jgi:hypothetical protein
MKRKRKAEGKYKENEQHKLHTRVKALAPNCVSIGTIQL